MHDNMNHEPIKKVVDIVRVGEPIPQRRISRIPTRFTDAMRMLCLGLGAIVLLNLGAVYYRGIDLKNTLATAAYSGYETVMKDGPSASTLTQLEQRLDQVQQNLWFLQNQREEMPASGTVVGLQNLLAAGGALSKAGAEFLIFVEEARLVSEKLFTPKIQGKSLTADLSTLFDTHFSLALENLTRANAEMQKINPNAFPDSLEPTLRTAQTELTGLTAMLTRLKTQFPLLLKLLGDQDPQRYLVLLENSNEVRPGGGFIGSYMLLTLNDGYLDSRAFYDVYDLDNRYRKSIPPPQEIARLTSEWRFRDSNISPDLRLSAAKAAWFFQEEGGPSIDHVVTVDLSAVAELLTLTGPIKLDELPIALSSDNFATVLSYMVEAKLLGETTPKEILNRFIERVEGKVREQKPWLALGQWVQEMAASKHLSLYSKDAEIQGFFKEWGISGALPVVKEGEDYFMAVHTSIGGNKTDPYVTQDIRHETEIDGDGSMLNQVTITRTHHWNDTERLRLKNLLASFGFKKAEPWLIDLLGGGPNTSMMRIYVPQGSQLVSTYGLEQNTSAPAPITLLHDDDLNLDYFSFTHTVYPGTSSTFSLSYTLPIRLTFDPLSEYRLTVAKQPSDRGTTFTKIVTPDPSLIHYRSFPEGLEEISPNTPGAASFDGALYQFTAPLIRDLNMAQLWGREVRSQNPNVFQP